jgi:hypothetical protein
LPSAPFPFVVCLLVMELVFLLKVGLFTTSHIWETLSWWPWIVNPKPFSSNLRLAQVRSLITKWQTWFNSCVCQISSMSLECALTYCVATLALGSRPRQRGCKGASQREARESRQGSVRECRKVWESEPSHSQGNSHFGRWSPGGLLKLQRPIWGVKSQWLVALFVSMEISWSVDVWNGLVLLIWTSETQVMTKRRAGSRTPGSLPVLTPDH